MILVFLFLISFSCLADVDRLIKIDSMENGFEIYRMGIPENKKGFQEVCDSGISEMIVLSGDADKAENKWANICPGLKVIYDFKQSAKEPLTTEFISYFDGVVKEAREKGKKIGFRCDAGSHRTGRLAAYYKMKYNSFTAEEAIEEMLEVGKYMKFFPGLDNQVMALNDYINNRACSEKKKYCVIGE